MADEDGQGTGTGEGSEATFTQEDVNRINARANRRIDELQTQLSEANEGLKKMDALRAQVEELSEAKDLAGKSEIEKLQHQHGREVEKLTHKLKQQEEEMKVREAAVEAANQTLRTERTQRAFGSALQKAKVFGTAADDALAVLMSTVRDVEIDDNGAVRATYGDTLIDESAEKIATQFLVDKPHFAAGPGGGAGTKAPNHMGGNSRVPLHEMSDDQLDEMAGPMPAAARHDS